MNKALGKFSELQKEKKIKGKTIIKFSRRHDAFCKSFKLQA